MQNMLMPSTEPQAMTPPGAAQAPPAQSAASLADVATHRSELNTVMNGLLSLAAKPKGSLSKQDLFGAVADMISEGCFSTPDAKQQIIAQIAPIPDNEAAIRQAIGERLIGLSDLRSRFHAQYGAEG